MEQNRSQTRDLSAMTIGEIVADDYRTATVFEGYGIDYCCGGKVLLSTACREKEIDCAVLQRKIETIRTGSGERGQNYASWDLPFLADYIVNAHHTFVKENTVRIAANIEKIAGVHGDNHPEVIEIAAVFDKIATDLEAHLREEEELFFPALKRIDAARKANQAPAAKDRDMIRAFFSQFVHEHEEVGEALQAIRKLARDYAVPNDVCNTFTVTYESLSEFEDDLHKHVHLENNILFPKAEEILEGTLK